MTEEERIKQVIEQSFLGVYIEDAGITDISFDGSFLKLQHNEKGDITPPTADYPQEQPTLEQVEILIGQIADAQKKLFNHSEPELNTEVGYLRLNAVHRRVSPDGTSFAVRISRPRLAITSLASMTEGGKEEVEQLLSLLVRGRSNVVIAGSTGTGKTELQKLLVGYIDVNDKIGLIEDTRDSHMKKLYPEKHILSWQTIPDVFTLSDGVKAILRNNCVWAMIAETRGLEAADLLDAAKTDHSIITTLHAKSALDIPSRFIPMIRQAESYANTSDLLLGKEIVHMIPFGIHLEVGRENGKVVRRIKEIMEFTDFTDKGAEGRYLYQFKHIYNEETDEYEPKEFLGSLSEESLSVLKDKRLYHLLPDVFKGLA